MGFHLVWFLSAAIEQRSDSNIDQHSKKAYEKKIKYINRISFGAISNWNMNVNGNTSNKMIYI